MTDYADLKRGLYRFEDKIARAKQRINASESINAENKAAVNAFLKRQEARGVSQARVCKEASECFKLATLAGGKAFAVMTAGDVEDLILIIERGDYAANTKRDFRKCLKQLFKVLKGTTFYPPEVAWIGTKRVLVHKSPESLITEDEVKLIVEAALTDRDRALISASYYSNARIGELLTLTNDRVHDKGTHFILEVAGKTGSHDIPLTEGFEPLRRWLANHPLKREASFPVFVNEKNKPLSYASARKILVENAIRAGVTKKVNPLNFRHSRSTELSENGLSEQVLNEISGRVQGSQMSRVYVNLATKHSENAMLSIANKKRAVQSEAEESGFKLMLDYLLTSEGRNSFLAFVHKNAEALSPLVQAIQGSKNRYPPFCRLKSQAPGVLLLPNNKTGGNKRSNR